MALVRIRDGIIWWIHTAHAGLRNTVLKPEVFVSRQVGPGAARLVKKDLDPRFECRRARESRDLLLQLVRVIRGNDQHRVHVVWLVERRDPQGPIARTHVANGGLSVRHPVSERLRERREITGAKYSAA